MIEQAIKRIVKRLFPAFASGAHPSQLARIEKVHAIEVAGESTESKPLYCVDLQILTESGAEDTEVPILEMVPLPVNMAGAHRGVYGLPDVGALVELGFILGMPSRPVIRYVLAQSQVMPFLAMGDVLISKDEKNSYRIDGNNNIKEECQAMAERIAKAKQRLVVKDGGKIWVGNESDNVLQLLSDLMGVVISLSGALESHKHSGVMAGGASTNAPVDPSPYSSGKSSVVSLKGRVDAVTE